MNSHATLAICGAIALCGGISYGTYVLEQETTAASNQSSRQGSVENKLGTVFGSQTTVTAKAENPLGRR